jgi:hypothetical protein
VGPDPDNSRALAGIAARLTRFAEKIETTLRPDHPARTFSKRTCAADAHFEPVEQRIEADQILTSFVGLVRIGMPR